VTEAVFGLPELVAPANRRHVAVGDTLAILRVNKIEPGGLGGGDGWIVAEYLAELAAPPDGVAGEVPVPLHVRGRRGDRVKALLALAQFPLRLLAKCDVGGGADDSRHGAFRIHHREPAVYDPAHFAVGTNDTVLGLVRLVGIARHGPEDLLAVVLVDRIEPLPGVVV